MYIRARLRSFQVVLLTRNANRQGEDTIRANLEAFFGECGGVKNVRIPTDRETGEIKARGPRRAGPPNGPQRTPADPQRTPSLQRDPSRRSFSLFDCALYLGADDWQ